MVSRIRTLVDPTHSDGNDGAENTNLVAPTTNYNPWRYASGYYDPTTGFTKFGTRYYMPGLGTWTQSDPVNGKLSNPLTQNAYVYAWSNAINRTDPSGRSLTRSHPHTVLLLSRV